MEPCAYKTGASSVDELIIVRQYEGTPLLDLQAVLPAGDPVAAVHLCGVEELGTDPLFVDSRALVHACPHRIYIRFIFLNHNLKLSICLLSFSVVVLVSLNALAASRYITARSHVQATGQIVRTRKPVKQIQKRVGITKRKIEIAQVPLGEARAHGFRVGESQAVFGEAVGVTSFKSPQRFGRIAYKNKTLLCDGLMAG